jgi:hypothetical protein
MPTGLVTPPTRATPSPSDRIWFDPRVIVGSCEFIPTDITLTGATPTLLAKNNPRRVALGFVYPVGAVNTLNVGPWTNPNVFAFDNLQPVSSKWYYLHVHLNMVCVEWYGFSGTTDTVRVIEIRRR